MSRVISQREAHKLKKRVQQLERILADQRTTWGDGQWIGVEVARLQYQPSDTLPSVIRTARRLRHAVVVVAHDDGLVRFVALPHPNADIANE